MDWYFEKKLGSGIERTQGTSGMLAVVREMQHGFFSSGGKREGEAGNDKTQGKGSQNHPVKGGRDLAEGCGAAGRKRMK